MRHHLLQLGHGVPGIEGRGLGRAGPMAGQVDAQHLPAPAAHKGAERPGLFLAAALAVHEQIDIFRRFPPEYGGHPGDRTMFLPHNGSFRPP